MAQVITINIKFYMGTEQEADLDGYDFINGINLQVKNKARLRTVLKEIGFKKRSIHTFFRNGERIHGLSRLSDGDQISCLTAMCGG